MRKQKKKQKTIKAVLVELFSHNQSTRYVLSEAEFENQYQRLYPRLERPTKNWSLDELCEGVEFWYIDTPVGSNEWVNFLNTKEEENRIFFDFHAMREMLPLVQREVLKGEV